MARETDSYRDILADLYEFFGDKRLLTKHEVSRYLGKDPRTVEKVFGIGPVGIMAPKLARMLTRL